MRKLNLLFVSILIISLVSCSNLDSNDKKVENVPQEREIMEVEKVIEETYEDYKQQELDLLNEYKTHQDFWDNVKYYYEDEYKTKRAETLSAYSDLAKRYSELFDDIKKVDNGEEITEMRENIIYMLSKAEYVYTNNIDEGWSVRDINSEVDKLIEIINNK